MENNDETLDKNFNFQGDPQSSVCSSLGEQQHSEICLSGCEVEDMATCQCLHAVLWAVVCGLIKPVAFLTTDGVGGIQSIQSVLIVQPTGGQHMEQ